MVRVRVNFGLEVIGAFVHCGYNIGEAVQKLLYVILTGHLPLIYQGAASLCHLAGLYKKQTVPHLLGL